MSFEALRWAVTIKTGLSGANLTLIQMANRASPKLQFWGSQKWLASVCETTDRTIRNHLAELEKVGLISRCDQVEAYIGNNGSHHAAFVPETVVYRLNVERKAVPDYTENSSVVTTETDSDNTVKDYTVKEEERLLPSVGVLADGLFPEVQSVEDHQRRQEELGAAHGVQVRAKVPKTCPAAEMVAMWNKAAEQGGLATCIVISRSRANHLNARFADMNSDLVVWGEILTRKVLKSPFLTGKVAGRGGRASFKATLDWVIGPDNFVKIVEGNYVTEETDYSNVQ